MFTKFNKIWQKYGFEIILAGCIIFIIIFALFRIGKPGSWSSSYTYIPTNKDKSSSSSFSHSGQSPKKESRGEAECRRVLQKYLQKPFPNRRPDFLRNPVTGGNYNLELDCYDENLRLAVEYNGAQHYKYIPYFHKNKEAFLNQKYRDELKRHLCKENKITLIEVPNTINVNNIESYLLGKLRMLGYVN